MQATAIKSVNSKTPTSNGAYFDRCTTAVTYHLVIIMAPCILDSTDAQSESGYTIYQLVFPNRLSALGYVVHANGTP